MSFSKNKHTSKSLLKIMINKTKITFFALFTSVIFYAQNGINYKALIKDTNGNVVANQSISILASLEITTNAIIYREEHTVNTDNNGIAIIVIGTGVVQTGDFNDINWKVETPNLNIQVDIGNGYVDVGITEFQAVPYSLFTLNPDGLEAINEGNGIGWRFAGRNSIYYGNIGENAIDLSYQNTSLLGFGATGLNSFTSGFLNTSSGDYSTSFGGANEAIGSYSTAMGRNTEATASYTTSFGYFSSATGEASTAMGSTIASGDYSTSIGYLNEASGQASVAMGTNTIASGDNAVSLGFETEAIGEASTAFGRETEASGLYSAAFGYNTNASSNNAFSTGASTEASGQNSTAMGENTRAYGTASFVAGFESFSTGSYSIALGGFSRADGENSLAFGESSWAEEYHTIAIGEDVSARGVNATSIGYNNNAIGRESLAIGRGLVAQGHGQIVIGSYNEPIGTYPNPGQHNYATEPVFIVGSGTSENFRHNALTVLHNNNVGIGTSLPEERLHVIGTLRIGTETIADTGSNQLSIDASLIPTANNSFRLGNSDNRWIGVWATDGTINTSDRREKKNIKNLDYGLDEVLKMQPVSFNWKNENIPDGKLGLIAQDLQTLIPEVVKAHTWEKDETTGVLSKKELERLGVYYSDLVPVLIKAIQEQQETIDSLKSTIQNNNTTIQIQKQFNAKQSKALEALLSRVEALEQSNN